METETPTQIEMQARVEAREKNLIEATKKQRRLAKIEDYIYDKSQEKFWDLEDGTLNGPDAVDASIPIERWRLINSESESPMEQGDSAAPKKAGRPKTKKAKLIKPSEDIKRVERNQFVEGSTWWPGKPQIIENFFVGEAGASPVPGRRFYNQYVPPPDLKGDVDMAWPWINHVKKLWPDKEEHNVFFDYCAHMVQKTYEKCNIAIILSGETRIGKDVALQPVIKSMGHWNCRRIGPDQLFLRFQPFLKTALLVIDEVKPVAKAQAIAMYNILKPLCAAPPDTLPIEYKGINQQYVINILRIIMTTNDPFAMHIPEEDKRMFIMHSPLASEWFKREDDESYFKNLVAWMDKVGFAAVNAWLMQRDISSFDPKASAKDTVMKQSVCNTWGVPEDAFDAALDRLGRPQIVFGFELLRDGFDHADKVREVVSATRLLHKRMQQAGYVSKNPQSGQEKWIFRGGTRMERSRVAFVRKEMLSDENLNEKIIAHGENVVKNASQMSNGKVFELNKDRFEK
jgi:hypothetical protein